MVVAVD